MGRVSEARSKAAIAIAWSSMSKIPSHFRLERDQLLRVLTIQLGLLDATQLDQLSRNPEQSGGDSFASLI